MIYDVPVEHPNIYYLRELPGAGERLDTTTDAFSTNHSDLHTATAFTEQHWMSPHPDDIIIPLDDERYAIDIDINRQRDLSNIAKNMAEIAIVASEEQYSAISIAQTKNQLSRELAINKLTGYPAKTRLADYVIRAISQYEHEPWQPKDRQRYLGSVALHLEELQAMVQQSQPRTATFVA